MSYYPDLGVWFENTLGSAGIAGGGVLWYVITAFALWPVFAKADFPPWLGFVPIANVYVLVKIAGYSGFTILLFLVPIVNVLFTAFVSVRIGDAFGRSGWFSFLLLFVLAPIGYFVIGWGRDEFRPLDEDGFRTAAASDAADGAPSTGPA